MPGRIQREFLGYPNDFMVLIHGRGMSVNTLLLKIIICNIQEMFHSSGDVIIIIIGDYHFPGKIHIWFQIIAVEIIKRSENLQIMFGNKSVADIIGDHAFNGLLIAAGHNDAGSNPRFFENGFIDSADALPLMTDDKGSVVEPCDIHLGKVIVRTFAVTLLSDLVVTGRKQHHSALQEHVMGKSIEFKGERDDADIDGSIHQKLF